jgi:hypothetical protein
MKTVGRWEEFFMLARYYAAPSALDSLLLTVVVSLNLNFNLISGFISSEKSCLREKKDGNEAE